MFFLSRIYLILQLISREVITYPNKLRLSGIRVLLSNKRAIVLPNSNEIFS